MMGNKFLNFMFWGEGADSMFTRFIRLILGCIVGVLSFVFILGVFIFAAIYDAIAEPIKYVIKG